jgi:tetratricopeptide (TPR) repeat protein
MMGAVLAATCAVAVGAVTHVSDRIHAARAALADGRVQAAKGEWDLAAGTLRRGLAAVQSLPLQGDLVGELERRLAQADVGRAAADQASAAAELHRLADRARFLYGVDPFPSAGMPDLVAGCRAFWNDRERVVARLRPTKGADLEPAVRADLIDIAICWADCAGREMEIGPSPSEEGNLAGARARTKPAALAILDEAEALVGPGPVLDLERGLHGATNPNNTLAPASQTAWEHYAVGRALLRTGNRDGAAVDIDRAVQMEPQGLWPNFYQGVCAYRRGQCVDAVTAFGVCIGAAPDAAGCYYNRALAFAALGRTDSALRDYDQALRLNSTLASPALEKLRHSQGPPQTKAATAIR